MFFMPLLAHSKWQIRMPKIIIAIALTLIGSLTIIRGMNLGIPYVSPKMNMKRTTSHQTPSLECCEDTCSTPPR
jgi:hypothetical protein